MISWEIPRGLISHALQSKSRHSGLCSKNGRGGFGLPDKARTAFATAGAIGLPLNSRAVGQRDQEFFALPTSLKCSMSARNTGEVLRLLG